MSRAVIVLHQCHVPLNMSQPTRRIVVEFCTTIRLIGFARQTFPSELSQLLVVACPSSVPICICITRLTCVFLLTL